MSFIPVAMDTAREDEFVPKGKYDLEVTSAKFGPSKSSNKPMISLVVIVTNPPENIPLAAPIFHYLPIPITEAVAAESGYDIEVDDEATSTRKARDIRRFMVAFGVHYEDGGLEIDDLAGAVGQGIQVDVDSSGDMGPQHKMILDRVTDEQAASFMGGGTKKGGRRRGRA